MNIRKLTKESIDALYSVIGKDIGLIRVKRCHFSYSLAELQVYGEMIISGNFGDLEIQSFASEEPDGCERLFIDVNICNTGFLESDFPITLSASSLSSIRRIFVYGEKYYNPYNDSNIDTDYVLLFEGSCNTRILVKANGIFDSESLLQFSQTSINDLLNSEREFDDGSKAKKFSLQKIIE